MDTDVGPTHVDDYGRLAGWLCPWPRMSLATVTEQVSSPEAPSFVRPAWVDVMEAPRYPVTGGSDRSPT